MTFPRYSVKTEFCALKGPQFHVNYNPMEGVTHTLATYSNMNAAALVISSLRAAQNDLT